MHAFLLTVLFGCTLSMAFLVQDGKVVFLRWSILTRYDSDVIISRFLILLSSDAE